MSLRPFLGLGSAVGLSSGEVAAAAAGVGLRRRFTSPRHRATTRPRDPPAPPPIPPPTDLDTGTRTRLAWWRCAGAGGDFAGSIGSDLDWRARTQTSKAPKGKAEERKPHESIVNIEFRNFPNISEAYRLYSKRKTTAKHGLNGCLKHKYLVADERYLADGTEFRVPMFYITLHIFFNISSFCPAELGGRKLVDFRPNFGRIASALSCTIELRMCSYVPCIHLVCFGPPVPRHAHVRLKDV